MRISKDGHKYVSNCLDCYGCPACEVRFCGKCMVYETGLPTHCPGVEMTARECDLVFSGELDFVDGRWVKT